MAEWSKKRVEANELNNGREFANGDGITANDINGIFNSVLHNQEVLENIKTYANKIDTSKQATSEIQYDENGMIALTFGIPQGEQGEKGTIVKFHNNYTPNITYNNNETQIDIVKYVDGNIYIPNTSIATNEPTNWNLFLPKGEGSTGGNVTIGNASSTNFSDTYVITNVMNNSDGSITCNLSPSKENVFFTIEYNNVDINDVKEEYRTLYANYNSTKSGLTFVVYDVNAGIETYCKENSSWDYGDITYFKGSTNNFDFNISLNGEGNLTLEKVYGDKLDASCDLVFYGSESCRELITINNNFQDDIEIVSINNLKVLSSNDLEKVIKKGETLTLSKGSYLSNVSGNYYVKILYLYKNKLYYKNVVVIPSDDTNTYSLR